MINDCFVSSFTNNDNNNNYDDISAQVEPPQKLRLSHNFYTSNL